VHVHRAEIMTEPAPNASSGRSWAIGVGLALLVGYTLLLISFLHEGKTGSSTFNAVQSPEADALHIESSVLVIDPSRDTLRLRLEMVPAGPLGDKNHHLTKDLSLFVDNATGNTLLHFKQGDKLHPIEVTLELFDGEFAYYPIDRYTSSLALEAYLGDERSAGVPLTLKFTSKNHTLHVDAALGAESTPSELNVDFTLYRPTPVVFFVVFVYLIMAALTAGAATVTVGVLLRGLRPEFGMFTWTAALLFAFPGIRNSLPGTPPLGCLTDFLIFFWAEIIIALCMIALLVKWIGFNLKK
jgi:hypothetical protein